jgi:hypothetical protein
MIDSYKTHCKQLEEELKNYRNKMNETFSRSIEISDPELSRPYLYEFHVCEEKTKQKHYEFHKNCKLYQWLK